MDSHFNKRPCSTKLLWILFLLSMQYNSNRFVWPQLLFLNKNCALVRQDDLLLLKCCVFLLAVVFVWVVALFLDEEAFFVQVIDLVAGIRVGYSEDVLIFVLFRDKPALSIGKVQSLIR